MGTGVGAGGRRSTRPRVSGGDEGVGSGVDIKGGGTGVGADIGCGKG